MTNENSTIWLVFNGEIYNYASLRNDLMKRGHEFRSHSDTEVIIHLYEEFGPECVRQLRGMFAFALWDSPRRRLLLARDRLGIKPLYYSQTPDALVFASEFKAILPHMGASPTMNANAVRTALCFGFPAGPETIITGVQKLSPGAFLDVKGPSSIETKYWDLDFPSTFSKASFPEATEALGILIRDAVRTHMIADVPVGVLLSGGVDSSAVLSIASQSSQSTIDTFTVGFAGSKVVDERPFAKLTSERFNTRHHEISMSCEDFWNFLPNYACHMEEPVCEPPAVALYYVSRLAREHVKVVLSGEGGDEAFAGYPNYPNMLFADRLRRMLGPFATPAARVADGIGAVSGDSRFRRYALTLNQPLHSHYFSRASTPLSYFVSQAHNFFTPEFLASTNGKTPETIIAGLLRNVSSQPLLNQLLYVDSKTWLPDDLLIKADRMTMANSIELRVPLLDHHVLEFAATLPPEYKVDGGCTKRILKAAFSKILPQEVLNRKKVGFPVPYEDWISAERGGRVKEILLSPQFLGRGICDAKALNRLAFDTPLSTATCKSLFILLVMELSFRRFLDLPPNGSNGAGSLLHPQIYRQQAPAANSASARN